MARGTGVLPRHVLQRLLISVGWLGLSVSTVLAEPASDQQTPLDEQTAKAYNDFRDKVVRQVGSGIAEITRRYSLDEQQTSAVRDMIQRATDDFLKENGHKVFDLVQRGEALQKFLRESGGGLDDVPAEIRQDLADRVLPVMEALEKQVGAFLDQVKDALNPEQQAMLEKDRRRMEMGLRMAKAQVRVMGGRAPAEGQSDSSGEAGPEATSGGAGGTGAPGGAGGDSAGPRERRGAVRRAGGAIAANVDAWETYVRQFAAKYGLDEVQKLKAMDLLKEYKVKAEKTLERLAASQPASAPGEATTRPATVAEFRTRLARSAEMRKPVAEVFEQLKAELDKLPTPVQRQWAGEDVGPRASSQPSTRSAAAP